MTAEDLGRDLEKANQLLRNFSENVEFFIMQYVPRDGNKLILPKIITLIDDMEFKWEINEIYLDEIGIIHLAYKDLGYDIWLSEINNLSQVSLCSYLENNYPKPIKEKE